MPRNDGRVGVNFQQRIPFLFNGEISDSLFFLISISNYKKLFPLLIPSQSSEKAWESQYRTDVFWLVVKRSICKNAT